MTDKQTAAPAPKGSQTIQPPADESPWKGVWRDVLGGGLVRSILAIVLALFLGSLLVVATSPDVQKTAGYFFARPGDFFNAAFGTIGGAYRAIWEGAVFNPKTGFKPLGQTLIWATPLITAGLGIALGFRAGLFNIGGRGQMLIAALFTGFVGASWPLPYGIHLVVAILAGVVGGALWAGIVGVLKARTGAHEVILTIMLNFVALNLVTYLLKTPLFQADGAGGNAKSKPILETAQMPDVLGPINISFVIAIAAAVLYWWLMDRSTVGFNIRAVGLNPSAARTAGINVERTIVITLSLSGAFMGLAGVSQVLQRQAAGYDPGVDAGIGFDAITVALLGANSPVGVVLAALLIGGLKAGSFQLRVVESIPIEIVSIIQAIIVLLIAAPPLIRAIFRLPKPTGRTLLGRLRAARELARTGTTAGAPVVAAPGATAAMSSAGVAAVEAEQEGEADLAEASGGGGAPPSPSAKHPGSRSDSDSKGASE